MIISDQQLILLVVYVVSITASISTAIAVLLVRCTRSNSTEARLYRRGKYFLALTMLVVGIINSVLIYDGWGGRVGLVEVCSTPLLLCGSLAGGMITFLALAMMRSPYVNVRNIIRHLTPGIAMTIICLTAESLGDGRKLYTVAEFWQNIGQPEYWLRLVFAATYLTQCVTYSVIFFRERTIYMIRIKDYFSDLAHLELRGVTWTFYIMQCLCIATLVLATTPTVWGDMTLTLIVGGIMGALGISYINYQYTLGLLMVARQRLNTDDGKETIIDVVSSESITAKLNEYMRAREAYSDSGLVISDVAIAVGMNPRELSAYINRVYGVNFNAWVNSIRIDAAKQMISDDSSRPLSDIATIVGFSDLSVFSRAFKRHEELSPSAYRNRCRAGIE